MKLTFSPISICRTPIFSSDEILENVWPELKEYIHESSPAFFEVIKDLDYSGLALAETKTRFTVWKYFNRAKYRATPYGRFAAFSLVPVEKENSLQPIALLKEPVIHRFANWQEKENISFDPKWLTHNAAYFRTNTTIYKCDEELRYISIENGAFELSAIMNEDTTRAVLDFCHLKRSLIEIQGFLKENGIKKSITNYLLEQLISFQLLITDFHPNIVGTDYFNRIGHVSEAKKNDYIIAERKRSSGYLPEKNLKVLTEVTEFLNKNMQLNKDVALIDFKDNFLKRFEDKEVSLLTAMDPEIGIGYKSLIHDNEEDALVQDLKALKQEAYKPILNLTYSPLHQFILNQFILQKVVKLEDFAPSASTPIASVANTISIMFQQADEYLVVEQIGGCTANALLGRFTMASEEVTALGNRFAEAEQKANPDVIFFDIAYQIEKNADNINRRRAVYSYELPILSWTESKQILDVDDIMVSISGDDIILRSIKYGKRVVPKLASAYNYGRSDLAIYRFLSDLQHQHLHSGLGINVSQSFPGLLHYQRIQYKNVILSPEKWLVPDRICTGTSISPSLTTLKDWLLVIQLDRPFKCGVADQTLLFNPSIEADLEAFILFCKNKKELYIEEAFLPVSAGVKDEFDQPYLSEFIINLEHSQQIYQPYINKADEGQKSQRSDVFVPGEDWLYFEIYCHHSRSNMILMDIAGSLLPVFRKKIKNWFFIRYTDPSNHIRLRLQLKDVADAGELLTSLSKLLKPYVSTGIIADVQLKTYRQETVRYGAGRIGLVEKCFRANSEWVMEILTKSAKINELYMISMSMIEKVWETIDFTLEQQLIFAENMANRFALEMNINPEGFKKINQGFKDFDIQQNKLSMNKLQFKKGLRTERYFLEVLQTCNLAEKNKMLSDLFHMHTNRLFMSDQRVHEMIMYFYLTRKLKIKIGRMKKEGLSII